MGLEDIIMSTPAKEILFDKPAIKAETLFPRITTTIKESWHPTLHGAGISQGDCSAVDSAFAYDTLSHETESQDVS